MATAGYIDFFTFIVKFDGARNRVNNAQIAYARAKKSLASDLRIPLIFAGRFVDVLSQILSVHSSCTFILCSCIYLPGN